jgi:hypothetical protein
MAIQIRVPQPDGDIQITQGNPWKQLSYSVANSVITVEDVDAQLVLDHISGAEVVKEAASGSPTGPDPKQEPVTK